MSFDVFVFDLDFTLWDAGGTWCDATNPPYVWRNNKLLDRSGRWISLYPDVIAVLEELKNQNKFIAAASRTYEPEWAQDLLNLFDIDKYFDTKEIYPASKISHFKKIRRFLDVPYQRMVFFDDEYRNIEDVSGLGVEAIFVRNGIDLKMVDKFL
ncbi:magnesium-dependent phosphatase-1 [Maribellus comscasis]|uniref:Magnesium-dependent phosphatase-1 n=1 Tax=Maribellus comscasis TaxID=2681766 RepID=A0A6I6K3B1_9BACT|nr:magnesium-dependent phosphatase-1 [Maribellus comscasis]QGY47948.1 magnesium-dependent phosphatase-1 [Maribellus comscasis]